MKLFISWSGPKSGAVAKALREWLPMVVNAFEPFLSSDDIDKGTRWNTEIAQELEQAKAGIICLTAGNLHSDWLLFEAGALSKKVEQSFVCPLLIDLKPSDVVGPLAQFQATVLDKTDALKLLKTLNLAAKGDALSETHIEKAFDKWWPDMEAALEKLPSDKAAPKPERSDKAILEEILELVREQNRPKTALWEAALTAGGLPTESSIQLPSSPLAIKVRESIEAVFAGAAKHLNISPAIRVAFVQEDDTNLTYQAVVGKRSMRMSIPKLASAKRVMAAAEAEAYKFLEEVETNR